MPFLGNSEQVARKLQSCLIQSGNDVIMCLKVEVYSRLQSEDPHADAFVAFPGSKVVKVASQLFNRTSQLMIGTTAWSALVTMGVVLTSGKVIVGPHNIVFNPHSESHIWLKKVVRNTCTTMWSVRRGPTLTKRPRTASTLPYILSLNRPSPVQCCWRLCGISSISRRDGQASSLLPIFSTNSTVTRALC
ncbi:hypothetical protein BCR41DRAFT_405645 [Lobosporangium transversale]|uniref:Uncharacterized protein n=1 Tax=Lobosporangium transversale TaxID=64571 RepID=A0A1Y2GNQ4_9FUNG|nr:hypothetical protein BCR41DRAFT_405645 [Lobosporangium transversale]ORZ16813.1 hypothetical protein BCR41DRAFT_405645 [Lobosporangium transversale]|eukprot:XP_021881748.1 hypothetical protein BCR41DRAFT_405645 [Lobosporangium transversale]